MIILFPSSHFEIVFLYTISSEAQATPGMPNDPVSVDTNGLYILVSNIGEIGRFH